MLPNLYQKNRSSKHQAGFNLIELIISIVILGIALLAMMTSLFPQFANSAQPSYQARASAIGQSILTEILARGFDNNSDFNGGAIRCGEEAATVSGSAPADCSTLGDFGAGSASGAASSDGETNPSQFNDVDDYLGCWSTQGDNGTCTAADGTNRGNLSDIFGNQIETDYAGFRAIVTVAYDNNDALSQNNPGASDNGLFKVITVAIVADRYGTFTFSAYRGNY